MSDQGEPREVADEPGDGDWTALTWEQVLHALLELVDVPSEIEVLAEGGPECRFAGPIQRVIVDELLELGFSEVAAVHTGTEGLPRLFFAREQFVSAGWTDGLRTRLVLTLRGGTVYVEDRSPAKYVLSWERRVGEALCEPDPEYRAARLALLGAMAYGAGEQAADAYVAARLAAIARFLGDYCGPLLGDGDNTEESE